MEAMIYLVTYKGQTESVYTWGATSYSAALVVLNELKREYPDREWSICEKDVS